MLKTYMLLASLITFVQLGLVNRKNVCLYDFVAHYKYDGTDKNGERKYRKLTKPVLPNHKIFNPLKEEERESLLLTHDPVCSFRERSGIDIRWGNC